MTAQPALDLTKFRQRFLDGLGRRLDELAALIDVIECVGDDQETGETIRRGFHSIAGIGGTYGFPEVSELALEGETVCDIVLSTGSPFSGGSIASARWCVAEMKAFRRAVIAA